MTNNILVFGASGAIGGAIAHRFASVENQVFAVSRQAADGLKDSPLLQWISWDVTADNATIPLQDLPEQIDAIVWAQGANCSDDIYNFDQQKHEALYMANVSYILLSLNALLTHKRLAKGARLCVISSIWQNIARPKKLSYCISKAAIQGLVQSLAIDLGPDGYLINAVLPGALDTPMTRANLSVAQIEQIEHMTPLAQLPTLEDVSRLVCYLCSSDNTGITGQFIAVDKGFSNAKFI